MVHMQKIVRCEDMADDLVLPCSCSTMQTHKCCKAGALSRDIPFHCHSHQLNEGRNVVPGKQSHCYHVRVSVAAEDGLHIQVGLAGVR